MNPINCISGELNKDGKMIIEVEVAISSKQREGTENASIKKVKAMLDTGADWCALDASIIADLGLTILQKTTVPGFSGSSDVTIHEIFFRIPELNCLVENLPIHSSNTLESQGFEMIIGTRFLSKGTLTLNKNAFSFCI